MSSLAIKFDERVIDATVTPTSLCFLLADGREISAPLEWFPKLRDASRDDCNNWQFIGDGSGEGIGVRWPELDEEIAVQTLMRGGE